MANAGNGDETPSKEEARGGGKQGSIRALSAMNFFLSNSVGGAIAKHAGPNVAFMTLAAIAGAGLVFFWVMMPETREQSGQEGVKPQSRATGLAA